MSEINIIDNSVVIDETNALEYMYNAPNTYIALDYNEVGNNELLTLLLESDENYINIIEQNVIVEDDYVVDTVYADTPKLIEGGEIYVYIPIGSTTQKGIVSFNNNYFRVVDGVVTKVLRADADENGDNFVNTYQKIHDEGLITEAKTIVEAINEAYNRAKGISIEATTDVLGLVKYATDEEAEQGDRTDKVITSNQLKKYGGKIDSISLNDNPLQIDENKNVNINIDKTDVGLGNVDNTSDVDKPISNATKEALDDITSKIPNQATSENQLADKDFVNSSIETATATFKGTYTNLDTLFAVVADKNDYTFYDHLLSNGNRVFDRYKYDGTTWVYEYTLNNSSFTDAQWKAINSGATTELINQIVTNVANINALLNSVKTNTDNITLLENKKANQTSLDKTNATVSTMKTKLDGIETGAEVNTVDTVNGKTGEVNLTAEDVGALPNDTPIPSKTSDLKNDSGFITGYTETDPTVPSWAKASTKPSYTYNEITEKPILSTVATTGSYDDLSDKPTIPTTASEVDALPNTTKYGASLYLSINTTDYKVTAQLKDQNGNNLGDAKTIDLPLESVVVSGRYDSSTKKVVLTLQNDTEISFSVADLVSGLQNEITSTNKLASDLVDDTNQNNKFMTADEKSKLSGIQAGAQKNPTNYVTTNTEQSITSEKKFNISQNVYTQDHGWDSLSASVVITSKLDNDATATSNVIRPVVKVSSQILEDRTVTQFFNVQKFQNKDGTIALLEDLENASGGVTLRRWTD